MLFLCRDIVEEQGSKFTDLLGFVSLDLLDGLLVEPASVIK